MTSWGRVASSMSIGLLMIEISGQVTQKDKIRRAGSKSLNFIHETWEFYCFQDWCLKKCGEIKFPQSQPQKRRSKIPAFQISSWSWSLSSTLSHSILGDQGSHTLPFLNCLAWEALQMQTHCGLRIEVDLAGDTIVGCWIEGLQGSFGILEA